MDNVNSLQRRKRLGARTQKPFRSGRRTEWYMVLSNATPRIHAWAHWRDKVTIRRKYHSDSRGVCPTSELYPGRWRQGTKRGRSTLGVTERGQGPLLYILN